MNQFVKTLLWTLVFGLGFAGITWSISHQEMSHYGNSIVLDKREITALKPVGPFDGHFLLSQRMDMDHINFSDEVLDKPVCLSLFLDSNFPRFEHVPFRVALVGEGLDASLELNTAIIRNDFGRICFEDTPLRALKGKQVSIQISAASPDQTNIARVILTPFTKGFPADINGSPSDLSLPFILEIQQPITRHQWTAFVVINLIVSLVLAIVFVQTFSRSRR